MIHAGVVLVSLAVSAGATGFPTANELPRRAALPDVLDCAGGTEAATAEAWIACRTAVQSMLLHYEYGSMPPAPGHVRATGAVEMPALGGRARLRHFQLTVGPGDGGFAFEAGLLLPAHAEGPVPVILAIDPVFHPHVEPVAQRVIGRGMAFAGFVYHDVDDDDADRSNGIYPHFPGHDWGTIGAWAWAAMRMVDYLVTQPEIDARRIVITGHSRTGKAALLAGALDERIAVVAPHSSGAGGSGSFRKPQRGAETLAAITDPERFQYWFHPRLREFAGEVDRLPFDQHFLMALIAPRRLFTMETRDDAWSNPQGAQRMVEAARPVFRLLGVPTHAVVYMRPGGHDTTSEDWDALLRYVEGEAAQGTDRQ